MAKIQTGGGATGHAKAAEPTGVRATLPNSNMNNGEKEFKPAGTKVGFDEIQETDPENNTKTTKDDTVNKASIKAKGKPTDTVKESDLDTVFAGTEFSEEFKKKVFTVFEAIVNTKIGEIAEDLETQYNEALQSELESAVTSISEGVDEYLDYLSHEFMEENILPITRSIHQEMSYSMLEGFRQVLEAHYVDIPEDKVDVLESYAEAVTELEAKLSEQIEKNMKTTKVVESYRKRELIDAATEGLTELQRSKLRQLAENISFKDDADLTDKVNILKEATFPELKKTSKVVEDLTVVTENKETKVVETDMQSLASLISRNFIQR